MKATKVAVRTTPEDKTSPLEIRRISAVPASAEAASPWVDHDVEGYYGGVTVRETRGHGLPLVLIHAESSSKEVFRLQMLDALGARYRMLAIDLPSLGSSDAAFSGEAMSMTSLADLVIETLERLGIERFAILGWSLGACVALEIASSAPGVAGVMVVSPPLPDAAPEHTSGTGRGQSGANDGVGAWADRESSSNPSGSWIVETLTDQRDVLSSLSVPVAIVNGANDPVAQCYDAGFGPCASLWEGRQHVFPHAGRAPFLDAPELFNATLARFMHHLESAPAASNLGLCLAG